MAWEDVFSLAYATSGADPAKGFSIKQRAFDANRATRRTWLGTRRSGKTRGLAGHMLRNALPGETVPYCAPTIGTGRRILWPQLEQMDRELGLGLAYDRSKHIVTTREGGRIQCFGLSTMPEAEKLRGNRWPLVVFDESGAIPQNILKYAVVDCASPATTDFIGRGGRGVVLAGTPSRLIDTYWHEQCKAGIAGNDPSFMFTTLWDNPFYAGREELVIEAYLADNKLKRTDAAFIREMLGQFCIDLQALCYSADKIVEIPAEAIPKQGMTICGVDFGLTHPCSFNVIRIVDNGLGGKSVFVCESRKIAGLTVPEVAKHCRELRAKWNVGFFVGDSEGATIIKTLEKNHGIAIRSAAKVGHKIDRIWDLDSHLRAGSIFFGPEAQPLMEELREVGLNDTRDDHHPNQPDHCVDGIHYAIELASAIGAMPKPKRAKAGTPEWEKEQEEALITNALRQGGIPMSYRPGN